MTGPRHDDPDTESEAAWAGVEESFERASEGEALGRRAFLLKMLGVAGGAFGVALLFPIRSLGPNPGRELRTTAWRRDSKLVDENGRPVSVGDVVPDGVLTVFPEGHTDAEDSQVVLINVGDALTPPPGRETWSPDGLIAFSKICTHAGCPVGLYRATNHQLLCPCHQSTFDVLDKAKPVFGPATRSLPQLPLRVDENGFLVAQHDFDEPVGPAYWDRP